MTVSITPGAITGDINAPTSKSSMQRACAAALLHHGTTLISNAGQSNDDLAAIEVIQHLGASVTRLTDNTLSIESTGVNPTSAELNCGESGLGIRMFAPIAALAKTPLTINGSGSLLTRPMNFFDEVFPQLGVQISSNEGKLPINIQGPLVPAAITIDGSLSSQFLTGLLMAFGSAAKEPVTITVTDLKSKPYIDLTLQVMKHFGYVVENKEYASFQINPAAITAGETVNYTVEGDWSGGAFLLVAGAIAGEITVKGLDVFSTQADKAILQALSMAEAVMSIQEDKIVVGPGKLKAFHFNATHCPDLFPPLVALAAYCDGTTALEGVSRLAHKESNRGLTLQEEFKKLGIEVILQDDLMLIKGGQGVTGGTVHSHHDHRIAMACAVAGLGASSPVEIEQAGAVNKSYPRFFEDMQHLKQVPGDTPTV